MKALFYCCLAAFSSLAYRAQAQSNLHSGDLLFQNLDCGGMCDAIEAVTEGYKGLNFSHVGIVAVQRDSVFVIEAIGDAVQKVTLDQFRSRNTNQIWVGRLKVSDPKSLKQIVDYAEAQIGKPYDAVFEMKPDRFYCSELVYEAYRFAFKGREVFALRPMTFKEPGKASFFPVWVGYYKELGVKIPEGQPGINPGGISRSPKLHLFALEP